MYPNANTIQGGLMSQSAVANAEFYTPTTGRYFFVGAASLATITEIKNVYGTTYPDGVGIVFTTITLALAACVAGRGDVIIVCAGHTETVTAAAGIAVNVAGVSIFGLGSGTTTPTITFTTSTAATMTVTAANVSIQNIQFTCGIDAQVKMISITATDCHFNNCIFNTNSATVGAILGILTAATADRLIVNNCRFMGPAINAGTTTTAQIQYEAAVDIQIINNYFTGKMTQAVLNVTGTVLRGVINNNLFMIYTGTLAVSVAAASTPFITNNTINVPSGTTPIVAAAGFVAGNKYSAAAGVTAGAAVTF